MLSKPFLIDGNKDFGKKCSPTNFLIRSQILSFSLPDFLLAKAREQEHA